MKWSKLHTAMCNLDQVVQITRHSVCIIECALLRQNKGPSIYDVHTEEGGGQAQVDACGRGRGSSPMWTSTQKIKIRAHRRHTVFFSCKEVGVFFARISSLDRKKWKFFCDIN